MSERYTAAQYNVPLELMEPQAPITERDRAGNQYHVVNSEYVESEQLRSIPETANPVFLQSPVGEKAVRGAEFALTQENAYAERESRRNILYERMAKEAVAASVEINHDDTYGRMLNGAIEHVGNVADAAVRPEETPEDKLMRERQNDDQRTWNANIQNYENGKQ